jgi:hypothetical protein
MLLLATIARRSTWAWADQLVFWGVNLGLVGFLTGLIVESAGIKRASTPVMEAAILLGLLTAAVRLRETDRVPAPTVELGESSR